jgi:DNA-binding SARP family transcriptional activator
MEFRILGPLEVLDDARVIAIAGRKQRTLLAVLLLNANRVVSTDSLIDALWGETPPGTAGKAIQVYVSQLRRLLGKAHLQTKTPGYVFKVESNELDLHRFEALIQQAKDPDRRSRLARLQTGRRTTWASRAERARPARRHRPAGTERQERCFGDHRVRRQVRLR